MAMKSNYHVKISVSLPVKLIEKLDKMTTYKGKSRSKYIAGAITQRMEAKNADLEAIELNQALNLAHGRLGKSPRDLLMKEIIVNYLNPVEY